jgi:hypothetical protein
VSAKGSVACVVVASAARRFGVWDRIVPSVLGEGFDEVVVVGDWNDASPHPRVRYIFVDPVHRDTRDALLKRDIGTLATTADTIVYLCDDHALAPHFGHGLRQVLDESWDVLVPNRYTMLGESKRVLNNGEKHNYCGGHAGVFRRWVVTQRPWLAYAYHDNWRVWDVYASLAQQLDGARFCWSPRDDIAIEDLNPADPLHGLTP